MGVQSSFHSQKIKNKLQTSIETNADCKSEIKDNSIYSQFLWSITLFVRVYKFELRGCAHESIFD